MAQHNYSFNRGDHILSIIPIKLFNKLIISNILILTIFLSACANFDKNLNNLMNDTNTKNNEDIQKQREEDLAKFNNKINNLQNQINSLRNDLENLRPNILELTEIDEEIRKLLSELTKIDNAQEVNKLPEKNKKEEEVREKNEPNKKNKKLEGPISLTPKKTKQIKSENQLGIHLASFKKIELARNSWQEILNKHSDLLLGLDYRISSTIIKNKGEYFRLKAGPFMNKKTATETCRLLKEKKAYCIVTNFNGEK